jgi:two-component system chemotaxis response regulator CheY
MGKHMLSCLTKENVCRVLIIEDDPDDVFLFKRALDRVQGDVERRIECEHVSNGLESLLLIAREDIIDHLPDVLVLDLNMPRLDGIRFLRSLRTSLVLNELPVFVLTTSGEPAIHAEALRAGANKVFTKPNNADKLQEIVLEIICKSTGDQGLGGAERLAP